MKKKYSNKRSTAFQSAFLLYRGFKMDFVFLFNFCMATSERRKNYRKSSIQGCSSYFFIIIFPLIVDETNGKKPLFELVWSGWSGRAFFEGVGGWEV
jgi:hypothetical protein